MEMLKRCFKPKVIGGLVFVSIGIALIEPNSSFMWALPFLILAICPLSMLVMRQPNLSQHLTLLRQYKLVKVNRQGQKAYYSLADNKITKAVEMIYQFLQNQYGFSDEFPAKMLFPIVKDIVCGMRLSASEAFDKTVFHGTTYYFCASGCKQKFAANPELYLKESKQVIKV